MMMMMPTDDYPSEKITNYLNKAQQAYTKIHYDLVRALPTASSKDDDFEYNNRMSKLNFLNIGFGLMDPVYDDKNDDENEDEDAIPKAVSSGEFTPEILTSVIDLMVVFEMHSGLDVYNDRKPVDWDDAGDLRASIDQVQLMVKFLTQDPKTINSSCFKLVQEFVLACSASFDKHMKLIEECETMYALECLDNWKYKTSSNGMLRRRFYRHFMSYHCVTFIGCMYSPLYTNVLGHIISVLETLKKKTVDEVDEQLRNRIRRRAAEIYRLLCFPIHSRIVTSPDNGVTPLTKAVLGLGLCNLTYFGHRFPDIVKLAEEGSETTVDPRIDFASYVQFNDSQLRKIGGRELLQAHYVYDCDNDTQLFIKDLNKLEWAIKTRNDFSPNGLSSTLYSNLRLMMLAFPMQYMAKPIEDPWLILAISLEKQMSPPQMPIFRSLILTGDTDNIMGDGQDVIEMILLEEITEHYITKMELINSKTVEYGYNMDSTLKFELIAQKTYWYMQQRWEKILNLIKTKKYTPLTGESRHYIFGCLTRSIKACLTGILSKEINFKQLPKPENRSHSMNDVMKAFFDMVLSSTDYAKEEKALSIVLNTKNLLKHLGQVLLELEIQDERYLKAEETNFTKFMETLFEEANLVFSTKPENSLYILSLFEFFTRALIQPSYAKHEESNATKNYRKVISVHRSKLTTLILDFGSTAVYSDDNEFAQLESMETQQRVMDTYSRMVYFSEVISALVPLHKYVYVNESIKKLKHSYQKYKTATLKFFEVSMELEGSDMVAQTKIKMDLLELNMGLLVLL